MGVVSERADERRGGAPRLRGRAEGVDARRARAEPKNARSSMRWPSATSPCSTRTQRVEQDRAYAEAMQKVSAAYPDDLTIADALRRRAFPARAAAWHARPQRPERPPAARGARGHSRARRSSSRRLPSVRSRHRVDGRARQSRGLRRISGSLDPRRQPHQPHAVAYLERGWTMGRLGTRQSRGVALRSEGGYR